MFTARDLQCTTTELQVSSGRLQTQYTPTIYVVGFEEIFDSLLIHQVELSVLRIPVSSAIGERDDLVTLGNEVSSSSSSKKTTGTSDCDVFGYHHRVKAGEGDIKDRKVDISRKEV